MSFERPLLLLAGLVLPALYLLARRAARRREVAVPGLLLWRRIGLVPEPPRLAARRADRLLALRLVAAGLATIGLAGPRPGGRAEESVLAVVVDATPSMSAFATEAGQALRALADAAGGARLDVTRGHTPADLAAALDRAGDGTAVFITDHSDPEFPDGDRIVRFLVGREVENVGFVGGAVFPGVDGTRYRVVVRSHARASRDLVLRHPGGEVRFALASGETRVFEGPAPGGTAVLALAPGDEFAFDDRVTMRWAADPAAALRPEGDLEPHLAVALRAAGLLSEDPRARGVTWRREPGPRTALAVAPPGERRPVEGTLAGGADLAAAALPGPGTALGSVTRLPPGGTVLLSDRVGPVAVWREMPDGPRVEVGLDPGDPASSWALDPSFPVFVAETGRLLFPGAGVVEVTEGVLDPEESATAGETRAADLSRLRPGRRGRPAGGGIAAALLGAAAALLALHAVLEGRTRPA